MSEIVGASEQEVAEIRAFMKCQDCNVGKIGEDPRTVAAEIVSLPGEFFNRPNYLLQGVTQNEAILSCRHPGLESV